MVFACNTGGSCCNIVVAAVQGDKALKCVLPLEKAASSLSLGSGMAQVCLSELCVQAVDITTANPQLSFSLTWLGPELQDQPWWPRLEPCSLALVTALLFPCSSCLSSKEIRLGELVGVWRGNVGLSFSSCGLWSEARHVNFMLICPCCLCVLLKIIAPMTAGEKYRHAHGQNRNLMFQQFCGKNVLLLGESFKMFSLSSINTKMDSLFL